MKRKICIVTGSRAEYDLLKPIMNLLSKDKDFDLQIIVTGMHLSAEFGQTGTIISEDQFTITEKIEILLNSDSPCAIAKSTGLGVISFADSLRRLDPDFLLVLGDRFETLSVVIPSFMMKIPVIHLYGGETTKGVLDEGIRHAITKMSYLHFTSTEAYRSRVIQLGEDPKRVINVGALGVENTKNLKILLKKDLEELLDFQFRRKNILVTFHPVTLEDKSSEQHFANLLTVLHQYKDMGVIFTKANADADGKVINNMVDDFVNKNSSRSKAFVSMGQLKYLNTMRLMDAVVGNSSSGIIETPSFKVGTINIGDRQTGRIKADSVIDCNSSCREIENAFEKFFSDAFQAKLKGVTNPYDGGETSKKIYENIKYHLFTPELLKKKFYDIKFAV